MSRRISEGERMSQRNREIDGGMTRRHFAWEGCNGVWKTKAAIEGNVSLPFGSMRKGKISRRKEEGANGWRRSRRIREKGYRREEEMLKRDTSEHRNAKRKEAEPAERLSRFILDQLHFQPSSEYKRQFNYRRIFKAGSYLPSRLSLSFLTVFTSTPSPLSFVLLSVDGISLGRQENSIYVDTRARCICGYSSHYVHIVRRYNVNWSYRIFIWNGSHIKSCKGETNYEWI